MEDRTSIPDPPPIPGERDRETLTGSQPGTMGSGGFGAHNPSPVRVTVMDETTIHEHEKEGGGSTRDRD